MKKTRQELAHFIRKKPELREFIQLLSGQARLKSVCVFSVLVSLITTLPVWNPCGSSGYWVCLFFRQVWTCFMLSIGMRTVVATSWQRNLLGLERHCFFRRFWDLLVLRKMSCCCFHSDQTNSRQSSKKYDFDLANFQAYQPWFFRAGLWCLDSSIVWSWEKLIWRSTEARYICLINFQIGILRVS